MEFGCSEVSGRFLTNASILQFVQKPKKQLEPQQHELNKENTKKKKKKHTQKLVCFFSQCVCAYLDRG